MNAEKAKTLKLPSFALSAATILCVAAVMMVGLLGFHLSDEVHILLLVCLIIMAFVCFFLGRTWDDILDAMVLGLTKAMPALFFFFIIGMAVAAWIQCGALPALIYYGLNILSPSWFLLGGMLICSITSIATGSSWTTAGTVGVVLMGISMTMGIPAPITAGMIVGGAYLGDKMSPLSDTTNLAPAIAGTDVFTHVGAMMYTAVPAYIITLVIYAIMGLGYSSSDIDTAQVSLIQTALLGSYQINGWVLLPLLLVLILSILRFPAIPAMLAGIGLAFPLAAIFQDKSLTDFFVALNYGVESSTGVEIVDELLTRGGIQGMMWTFSLGVIALALGGLITYSGVMHVLLARLIKRIRNPKYYPALTIATGFLSCGCLGEQYMSIVLTGELWKDAYEEVGLRPEMLSRCIEEGATVSSPLFPWTTCGAYMYKSLGVYSFTYAPFAIYNILQVLFGALFPIFGHSLLKKSPAEYGTGKNS
ncbi:MAG: Na+/H+ antiporter NhaC [Synergistaceae bacterium]|jgi:NhaC family Na+:H+ antiporter|nr:Na+/H+ antiporter NhaC [Synergistaceae bacterium]